MCFFVCKERLRFAKIIFRLRRNKIKRFLRKKNDLCVMNVLLSMQNNNLLIFFCEAKRNLNGAKRNAIFRVNTNARGLATYNLSPQVIKHPQEGCYRFFHYMIQQYEHSLWQEKNNSKKHPILILLFPEELFRFFLLSLHLLSH